MGAVIAVMKEQGLKEEIRAGIVPHSEELRKTFYLPGHQKLEFDLEAILYIQSHTFVAWHGKSKLAAATQSKQRQRQRDVLYKTPMGYESSHIY